ncbi:MAG: hypothetical protein PHD95_03310 [Candidatus ainarchaeum sp.]|nr:hypothetical protein [Candidatus ainarchaeum sp.]
MMVLKRVVRLIMGFFKDVKDWSEEPAATSPELPKKELKIELLAEKAAFKEVHSVWDYLKIRENTQAHHLASVIGFEWIEMLEIRRRIKEQFGMEYQNERSLYPYIKTFTDCGLFESTDIGGKRKWRRKNILITTQGELRQGETEKPVEAKEKQEEIKKD